MNTHAARAAVPQYPGEPGRGSQLLDFGTAALTKGAQNNPTLTRLRMLTPRYASPEQIRGERVNTATDVFSLGVILYELLTGAWPFGDPNSMLGTIDRTSGHATAIPPPGAVTEEAARGRSASRVQLIQTLRGDLSAIVLKALEADPARRYESVRAMAVDLENFLFGRPVSARPQTAAYRVGKFLRRRWLAVSAAAAFVLALAAAMIVAVHQAQVAKAEALKAEKVNEFMSGMLSSTANTFTVVQMLEAAEERLDKSWTRDLRTEATLRRSLGASYLPVMKWDRARIQFEKSIAEFQSLGDEREVASSMLSLASLAAFEGHPAEAVAEDEQVLEKLKRLGEDAPPALVFAAKALDMARKEDPDGIAQVDLLYGLAVQLAPRDPSGARELVRQRYELLASRLGPDNAQTAVAKIQWARARARSGQVDEAAAQVVEAMEIVRRQFPPPSMDRWVALSASAHILNQAKRFKEAESLAREMQPIMDANHLPNDDPRRAESLLELGSALRGQNRNREADGVLLKSAAIYEAAGPNWSARAKSIRESVKKH
jgi:serine/threonine-protein kinase